jgi:hypothetical protein
MSRINYFQSNGSSGEISPQLYGRVDVTKYANSVATLENMYVKDFGGMFRRPGTYYVNAVKDSSKATRLIPFQFSTTQAYIIEVGDQYMRFYMNNGLIETGGVPVAGAYEIATPYLEADLFELQFAQDADTMYIVHKDYPQAKLTRTAHWTWTHTPIDYTVDPLRAALMDLNIETTTITPSADAGAGITLTASVAIFDASHVGSIWKIKSGWVEITAVAAGGLKLVATADVLYGGGLATGPGATTTWYESAWSGYRGYPACVCFFEERLIYAASHGEPQRIWGSAIGEYDNFNTTVSPVVDDNSFSYTIASQQVNAIQWLMATKVLAMGTSGGNFVASTGSSNEPISPTNIQIKPETSYGSALLIPRRIGHYVYYVQRDLRTIRELSYDYTSDSFVSLDMTLLSEHITESGVKDLDYQESPDNILWLVRDDGQIATLTRQIDQQIIGWSRQIFGGNFGGLDAVAESVATIPKGEEDQVWVIVKRTIGGTTKRYVEYLTPFRMPDEQEDCFYVDSGLSLDIPIALTAITKASPGQVTLPVGHGLVDGNVIRISGVEGMTEINKRYFIVSAAAATTIELHDMNGSNFATTTFTTYISGGEVRKCVTSVSGLTHLIGETVQICVDGGTHPDRVVSGAGAVTLDDYYSRVHVGYGYTSKIKGLKIEAGSSIGSGQGLLGKIMKVTIRFFRSLGAKVGCDDNNMDYIYFRDSTTPMNEATPLVSDDWSLTFTGGPKKNPTWQITTEQPLPLNVLAVMSYFDQEDI